MASAPTDDGTKRIMRGIKGRSASRLNREVSKAEGALLGAALGQVTEEVTKSYLEHHFEPNRDDNFKVEI